MINHLRTLLLNEPGSAGPIPGELGEEYVPREYKKLKVPPSVAKVRDTCFGRQSDRNLRNYRLQQLLTILHSTELVEFVTQLDSRCTYYPFQQSELFDEAFHLRVQNTVAPSSDDAGFPDLLSLLFMLPMSAVRPNTSQQSVVINDTLFAQFVNSHEPNDQVVYHRWKIVNDVTSLLIFKRAPGHDVAPSVTEALHFGPGGLSQVIGLPGSNASVRALSSSQNGQWVVTLATRPQGDVSDMLAMLESQISGTDQAALFGGNPRGDYKVFFDIWTQHKQLPYKLSAILLAAAYRLEEARQLSQFAE